MDELLLKISHMQRVLTIVGQQKIKDHKCWFCERAAGSNATGEVGLLNQLKVTIEQSSADAMRSIQIQMADTLTGRPLVEVSGAVRQGGDALEVFRKAFAGVFVDGFLSHSSTIQTVEDARHTLFQTMCAFCIVNAVIVSPLTLWHARQSKAKFPTAVPAG